MNTPADFDEALRHARQLQAEGRISEAELAYQQLANLEEHREAALRALTDLYLQSGRPQEAIRTMVALTEAEPDRLYYYARLAGFLEHVGQVEPAISHYLRLLKRQPQLAAAHYNLALLYKKNRQYAEAMASYEAAIRFGISDVEEVWSNMGVLQSELRQKDRAKELYERAIQANPAYVPGLFNLAGLLEESGERQRAIELYERIISINPRHWEALARLAHVRRLGNADLPLVDSLRRAIADAGDDRLGKEGLYFALGKALDDLGQFAEAFSAYREANEMGKLRNPPYDRRAVEQAFDRQIELFTPEWLQRVGTASTAAPIFICGMFRSGSTLVDQVLAAHPSVTSGGELDFLPWLIQTRLMPYPEKAIGASREELEEIGNQYLAALRKLFPHAKHVTDKRPDNILHLGLIKALFPAARIVYTSRNPLDNCLSVYFQQLGGNLNYATDLENIAHYQKQQLRLMAHWIDCFGSNIFTLDYDDFVGSSEAVLRRLLGFLGLEWDERCLTFYEVGNLVKTASVWQVREALYSHSSGRWRNYAQFLRSIDLNPDGLGV